MTTVGRFAPSPTGRMHLGNVWTALLAWLSVRAKGGRIVLRIEDVDRERCKPEYARLLMDDLARLGLDWDEGPIFQSERGAIYEAALAKLAERGLTYPCRCTRKELRALASAPQSGDAVEAVYPGVCLRNPAAASSKPASIRIKVPARVVAFEDGLLGRIEQRLDRDCGDFVLKRGDGMFAYQLAVVVDDGLMGVTEVLRGEDLADSTPRQLYVFRVGRSTAQVHPRPAFGGRSGRAFVEATTLGRSGRDVRGGRLPRGGDRFFGSQSRVPQAAGTGPAG